MRKFLASLLVIPLLLLQSCVTGPNIVQRYHQTYQTGTGQTFIHTGTVGNTGYRNMKDKRPPKYPHLHFEVHKNGSNIDAEPFFVGCFDPSKTYGPEEMTYPTGCPTKK